MMLGGRAGHEGELNCTFKQRSSPSQRTIAYCTRRPYQCLAYVLPTWSSHFRSHHFLLVGHGCVTVSRTASRLYAPVLDPLPP